MGSAHRIYKNNCRGILLPDGKTVCGKGRLGDAIVDRIQTYYGYAIRNNKGERDKIVEAIWAIYYHLIIGPSYESLEQQHTFCLTDEMKVCGASIKKTDQAEQTLMIVKSVYLMSFEAN